MTMKRWMHRAVLLAALLLVFVHGQAAAHANLLRATPEPNSVHPEAPPEIILEFSEALEATGSAIELLDAAGQRLTTPQARVDPADATVMRLALPRLDPGVYTVAWRALSAVDGHLTRGVYPFIVGRGVATPQVATSAGPEPGNFGEARPLDVLARVLALIGGALVVGGFGMHLALWGPVRATLRLPPESGDRRLGRMVAVGLGLLGGGALLALLAQLQALGSLRTLGALLLESRFGGDWILRVILLELLAVVAHRAVRRGDRLLLLLGLALAGGLLATTTALSHSAAVKEDRAAAVLNDWVHLAAASLWIGGLVHFLIVSVPALRSAPPDRWERGLGMLVRRFSVLGIASVAALIITGLYSGWLHVGSIEALRATAYGQTLLVKLVLLVPLLGLAGLNLLHWRRRLGTAESARHGFVRTLRAETVTGLVVLAVVGVLTGLGPAKSALEARQTAALTLRETVGPLRAALTIRPPRPGPARFEVVLTDASGDPYDNARRVRLQFTPPDPSLGASEATAEPQGGGHYVAEGAFLSITGRWRVELQIQRPDGYDLFTRYDLTVDQSVQPAANETGGSGLGNWLGWGLIGVGLGVTLLSFWLRRQREFVALSVLVLAIGILLLVTGGLQALDLTALSGAAASTTNPVPPTDASIARGRVLYGQHCAACHGATGRGDGPAAAGLNPGPADLQVHVPLHTDAAIFDWITNGIPGSAMLAQGEAIRPEDRWNIINYLRVLVSSPTGRGE